MKQQPIDRRDDVIAYLSTQPLGASVRAMAKDMRIHYSNAKRTAEQLVADGRLARYPEVGEFSRVMLPERVQAYAEHLRHQHEQAMARKRAANARRAQLMRGDHQDRLAWPDVRAASVWHLAALMAQEARA